MFKVFNVLMHDMVERRLYLMQLIGFIVHFTIISMPL